MLDFHVVPAEEADGREIRRQPKEKTFSVLSSFAKSGFLEAYVSEETMDNLTLLSFHPKLARV